MKKGVSLILMLTMTLTLTLTQGMAQRSTTSSNFRGGVRVGATTSQISADNLAGFDQFGAYAGAFVNYPLTDNLAWKIQAELDFVMKGSHSHVSAKAQTVNPSYGRYGLLLGYLEVPVLVRWNFGHFFSVNGKPVLPGLELEFGPAFGVNLFQHEKDMYGTIQGRPQFNRFEFSAMAGVACVFRDHHGVSLRYSNSLVPVRIPNWVVNGYIKAQFNSTIMLSYFYQF